MTCIHAAAAHCNLHWWCFPLPSRYLLMCTHTNEHLFCKLHCVVMVVYFLYRWWWFYVASVLNVVCDVSGLLQANHFQYQNFSRNTRQSFLRSLTPDWVCLDSFVKVSSQKMSSQVLTPPTPKTPVRSCTTTWHIMPLWTLWGSIVRWPLMQMVFPKCSQLGGRWWRSCNKEVGGVVCMCLCVCVSASCKMP